MPESKRMINTFYREKQDALRIVDPQFFNRLGGASIQFFLEKPFAAWQAIEQNEGSLTRGKTRAGKGCYSLPMLNGKRLDSCRYDF